MPSLYDSTANTGEVSSSNFTTLYNASGLQVPNAGAGSVTGNLNVGGNLTVQGTSLLIGDVTLQSTLSLPNYTFPAPDGTTDQVLVTDGNGNLYWSDVSAIPGADYNISATTATGGANLTLGNTAGFTDSVKFASGTNINIVRTDANTITISTTADDIPNGTAQGQVLYWNGSAWTANSTITSLATTERFTTVLKNTSTAIASSIQGVRDYGSVPYATGYASTMSFAVDSDSQAKSAFGAVGFTYSATDPGFIISSSTDNFTSLLNLATINGVDAGFNANNLIMNRNLTGAPTVNATFTVNRGSSTDATLTWNESTDTWDFSNNIYSPGGTLGNITIGVVDDQTITTNSGRLVLKSATGEIDTDTTSIISTNSSTFYLLNSPTTVNAFQGATTLTIGATGGTTTVRNDLTVEGNVTADGATLGKVTVGLGDDQTITTTTGELRLSSVSGGINLPSISSVYTDTTGSFALLNQPTAVNAFLAATSLNLGATTGTTNVNNDLEVDLDLTVNGGNINLNGTAVVGSKPFITFEPQPSGVNSQYGIRGKSSVNDPWFVGAGATGGDAGYLEIATGDNPSPDASPIYVRQYSGSGVGGAPWYGGPGTVVNSLTLLDAVGDTSIPNNVSVGGDVVVTGDITLSGVKIDLTTPVHKGQLLYVSNDATPTITNSSIISADAASYRPVFQYNNSGSGTSASLFGQKNYGATPYTTGDGTHIGFQIDSNSQPAQQLANIGASYDATAPVIFLNTNANANTTGPFLSAATFSTAAVNLAGSTLTLSALNTGAATNSTIIANRGSSGTDATLTWNESSNTWVFGNNVFGNDNIIATNTIGTNGNSITFNNENTNPPGDCLLTVKSGVSAGVDANIKWNDTTNRWQDTFDGTTYYNLPNQNLDTTDSVSFSDVTVDGIATFNSQTTTTTSTSTVQVAGTAKLTLKAIINVIDNVTGEMQVLEALAFRKGTAAYLTTYGEMYTNAALATFTVTGTGGLTSINATPLSTNSTTFTVARISLD